MYLIKKVEITKHKEAGGYLKRQFVDWFHAAKNYFTVTKTREHCFENKADAELKLAELNARYPHADCLLTIVNYTEDLI